MKKLVLCVSTPLILYSCFHTINEDEKNSIAVKCKQIDSIPSLIFFLTGFSYDEIKTVTIKEFAANKLVDSFIVNVEKFSGSQEQKQFLATIHRKLLLKNTFNFIIKGYKPYVLSNMTMVLRPHFSMVKDNYGCDMYQYRLNGKTYNDGNPVLKKSNI